MFHDDFYETNLFTTFVHALEQFYPRSAQADLVRSSQSNKQHDSAQFDP